MSVQLVDQESDLHAVTFDLKMNQICAYLPYPYICRNDLIFVILN